MVAGQGAFAGAEGSQRTRWVEKVLPKGYFSPMHTEMYDDTVAIIDWTPPISTIIMEKPSVVKSYKKYYSFS